MDHLASFKMPSMVIPNSSSCASNVVQGPEAPFIRIVEQPAPRALRFRYECEGRSAGSIPGASSSTQSKTHPTIQVMNHTGSAVVVVSCVTKEGPPFKPHPHNLVGREGCKKGVCTMVINSPDMLCSFTSLGIQCVKKKDIDESLRLRESIKVDPFKTGFAHRNQTVNIDLNVVRLCFQVFLQGPDKEKYTVALQPVVSEQIYDKKALSELVITKLSHHCAPVSGGTEIILLCDRITKGSKPNQENISTAKKESLKTIGNQHHNDFKINKNDVQICFYQEQQGQCVWDDYAEFQPSDVHKQFAICFRTPRYIDQSITQPVNVNIQLRRISDGTISEPRPFQYTPLCDPEGLRHKRQKVDEGCLDRYLREEMPVIGAYGIAEGNRGSRLIRQPVRARIKAEPEISIPHSRPNSYNPNTPFNMPSLLPLEVPLNPTGLTGASKLDFRSNTQGGSAVQDILSLTAQRMSSAAIQNAILNAASSGGGSNGSQTNHGTSLENMDTYMQETLEKFDSLGLGIEDFPDMIVANMDENLTLNLSASIFDSGNLNGHHNLGASNAINSPPSQQSVTTSTEENLQQISRLHTEISALNNLCGVVKQQSQ